MKRNRIIAVLALVLWCAMHDTAQAYALKNLGVEDGLSNNYVKHIVQDGQGFIWIATESGLNRFDGKNITSFTVSNSGLVNDAITALLYDKQDNMLWIGTTTILMTYNCATHQFYRVDPPRNILISGVIDIEQDADGNIWIANHHHGVVHYNKETRQYTAYSSENIKGLKNSNWCSFDDGKGYLYVGHAQDGLTIMDVARKTARHFRHDPQNSKSLPGNSVYSIFVDHLENIWMGTNRGLALFNPRTEEFLVFKHEPGNPHSLIADHIYDIKEMGDGTLWIASDIGGISILDLYHISFVSPETVQFKNIAATGDENGLSSGNIRSLLQDSFGNIWIGNYSSGVDFISHTRPLFRTLPYAMNKANKLKNHPVWGIYADQDQQIWVGGENKIAVFKENQLVRTIDLSKYQHRPYSQVFSMHENRKGVLLIGLYDDGLLRLDTRTGQITRVELGMEYVDIITFYEDTGGAMWIGAEYGIYMYKDGVAQKEEKVTNQLSDKSVFGILHDRQGKLWVGTYGGGVCVFDRDHNLVHTLNTGNGFFSSAINQLYLDSKGGVWIATRSGVGYVKDTNQPGQFDWYGPKHGLEDLFVRAIQEDASGTIWISTNQGVSFWNKQQQRFHNYNRQDGIPAGNFIEGSTCMTSDGTLYFGSLNGVCYFNPKDVKAEHQVAPVQIIDCKGFNKQVEHNSFEFFLPSADGSIGLDHDQNSLRISFVVPDYAQSKQVEYAYKMEGLDEVWSNTYGENGVTFRNLPPGNYRFLVKARLRNQDWDEEHIAALTIRIHPPLWLTWYAKLLYVCVIGLAVFMWIRSYKRKLRLKSSLEIERRNSQNEQNLNQERLRFYTNITHELRTPLTLILGPLEDLVNDQGLAGGYSKKIQTIHRSALRLLDLVNQILEFRKTETQNRELVVARGNLAHLVTEIGLRYKELNRNPRLQFKIHIETDNVELYFDADVMTTILNNLLSNAVKYTQEGEIGLTLGSVVDSGQEYTVIRVSDTGYGIAPEALPHIFDRYYQAKEKHQASGTGIGLALVKSLVALHEGSIEVESQLEKGTVFTLRLLTGNMYPDALHKETREDVLPQPEDSIQEPKEATGHSRPVLLIVEDHVDIREYIASSFSSEYKILEAENGQAGMEIAFEQIPDLIISDIMMPVIDGIDLCKTVKEDLRTCHIPIILLTAKDSMQDKAEGYSMGADSYLTKPFTARLLQSRVHNLLESRKKLAAAFSVGMKEEHPIENVFCRQDREFIEKITLLIKENIESEQLNITFLADHSYMSESTFYRKVKALTGLSGTELIRKVRIQEAEGLMRSSEMPISEIALRVGFNNMSYFRQSFKAEYGVLPSDYIKKLKGR